MQAMASLSQSKREERRARILSVLTHMPYAISFTKRVELFHRTLAQHRKMTQPEGCASYRCEIRRGFIVEDAFSRMSSRSVTGEALRGKLGVIFVNSAGRAEMGIDAGRYDTTQHNTTQHNTTQYNVTILYSTVVVVMSRSRSDVHQIQ